MELPIDQTRWYDRIWAAFIFFTRLPFWRLHQPDKNCYKTVVEHWPLVGWLTGGSMAAVIAALCAEGRSKILNVHMALRGYNDLEGKLRNLGINISIHDEESA